MAHEWAAGVLNQSSWHGLETVEQIPDAATMIARGEQTGAWPVKVDLELMRTSTGLAVPGAAVVASYLGGERKAHSAVGGRYTPLDPKEWRATVEAAIAAGAKPAGAFALAGGSKILATFEIEGGNGGTGLRNYLNIVDSLDGSTGHIAGGSSIRVVCANTLSMSMRQDGKGMQPLRHTASINDRAKILREAIEVHVKEGETVRELYRKARDLRLAKPDAEAIFSRLFPEPDEDLRQESPAKATRMENTRDAAVVAMQRPENGEGPTLATIWNAATWLVDRDEKGNAKAARGGADRLDSLLFGARGKRVQEIQNVIEVVLKDGKVVSMPITQALESGVDPQSIGRTLLEQMLNDTEVRPG